MRCSEGLMTCSSFFRVALLVSIGACSDSDAPTVPSTAPKMFERFVALGTSNSMGVQSAGIFAAGHGAACPAQLANRVGFPFSEPLIQDPGCGPPLAAPLASDLAAVGTLGNVFINSRSG